MLYCPKNQKTVYKIQLKNNEIQNLITRNRQLRLQHLQNNLQQVLLQQIRINFNNFLSVRNQRIFQQIKIYKIYKNKSQAIYKSVFDVK